MLSEVGIPVFKKISHSDTEIKLYKEAEIERTYLCNPFEFWDEYGYLYPNLKELAEKVLIIQATSSESERLFSIAGRISTKFRGSLSEAQLENITFLHSAFQNPDLWSNSGYTFYKRLSLAKEEKKEKDVGAKESAKKKQKLSHSESQATG